MPYDEGMVEDVVAEIVATVLEVPAEPGLSVAVGDTIVLLDSMKMEIPVLAEYAGVLAEVKVAPGDQVQAGDVLATYRD
ncbi:biotin/lipoyl-binding carrier protein [Gordonia caeni]|uniref:Biotin/lipoyl-binding carrier protein n=2 Tax=Gordonia caeni TaxID=1007097 RepID=A0ABP7NT99_9ACTN